MSETTRTTLANGTFRPSSKGPDPHPPRDGDKKQARQRINVLVRTGRLPHPNTLPCVDCGHIHSDGEPRHEYDHYLGYAAAHHYDVQVVCNPCHVKRDSKKAKQTHCKHGHEFTPDNTQIAANGTRHCKTCDKLHEKKRGPRGSEYWKKVNAKRKEKNYGK